MKKFSGAVATAAALVGVGMLPGVIGTAAAATDPAVLGTSQDTAAASCWEIKTARPTATDGVYWLVTPKMTEPAQFYCDMTTDGGGWVLVGKGRNGWTDAYDGKGDPSELQTPTLATMSSKTSQLPSQTIDALLGGGRVDALADGIRLRRATNTAGTTWQETRFKLTNRDRWVWTFGAEHPVGSWSFDGSAGSGGTSASFGSDTTYRRVVTTPQSTQTYKIGFAFGSRVAGLTADSSYLWSAVDNQGGALPFTDVYVRPKITSSTGFTAIADSGTAAITRPAVARSLALDSPWGVTGTKGNVATEGNVEVQAFTQSGSTMYVGGNFASVQQDAAGTGRVDQPFLAAFDVNTGAFIPTFKPVLNEQVHALATLPDGTVVAGGEFSQANGAAATGIVALDPTTGATKSGWKLSITPGTSGNAPIVRGMDVQDGWLYIAGANFTGFVGGPNNTSVKAKNLGRVSVTDGKPGAQWNGQLNGTAMDVDASPDGTRVYASGYFGKSGTTTALRAVSLTASSPATVAPQFNPSWSSTRNNYQRAVEVAGNRVYFGGSEHSLFGFDPTTMNRVSGSIMKQHGDIQAMDYDQGTGVLYFGCHCDDYNYQNAFTWPTLSAGWTQGDAIGWIGAVRASDGATIPNFVPAMQMRLGSGIWAITTDSNGNTWAGGDIVSATTKSAAAKWSGGFVRFDPSDVTPPSTPANFRVTGSDATTVSLAWNSVSDSSGGVRYEVLRDDRTILATTGNTTSVTVPKGGNNRFFVRAIDRYNNVSASTSVLVAP